MKLGSSAQHSSVEWLFLALSTVTFSVLRLVVAVAVAVAARALRIVVRVLRDTILVVFGCIHELVEWIGREKMEEDDLGTQLNIYHHREYLRA